MAALSALFGRVAPSAPGAADPSIDAAVLDAAIEFCTQTLCLQRTLAAVTTVAHQADYTLTQANEVTVKLLGVKLDGSPLRLLTPATLDALDDVDEQDPGAALLAGPMLLRLYPTPAAAGRSVVVRAAMRPAQGATTIDDSLVEWHAAALAAGATASLLGRPGTTFYNVAAARAARMVFDDAIAREISATLFGRARARSRPAIGWC